MIVVAGATGNVGREVVRQLVEAGELVRALVRDPAKAPSGVLAVAGDLTDPSSLRPALSGATALFLLSGYSPDIFTEAHKAGVRRVVLMLQWLPQLQAGVVRAPWPDSVSAVVDPADIAAVAAKALVSAEHEGREYPVTGPEALRPGDRVRILVEVLGRELRYEAQPDDEARAEMLTQMPEQYVDAFFSFYSDGKLDEATVFPTVEEVTGRRPRTFAEWVRTNVARLR